jgi:hypothetical protein
MALPAEVNNVRVKDTTEFDLNGTAMKIRVYTFWIQTHGPFTEKFSANEIDTPSVERRINNDVATLRAQGLLPTS